MNLELTNAAATPMAICSLVLQFKGVLRGSARSQSLKTESFLQKQTNFAPKVTTKMLLQASIFYAVKNEHPAKSERCKLKVKSVKSKRKLIMHIQIYACSRI